MCLKSFEKRTEVNREKEWIAKELNDRQREAVLYDDGPSLVVAGAGSGKTRALTCKIAHLLQNGYQPHTILALTFTNKAAREMKHRIASLTDEYLTRYLWMGTFHSIFYRILRREAAYIGFPSDFTIYDAADSKNLIKTIIREMKLDDKLYHPGMIQTRISNAKNALITSNAYETNKELQMQDIYSKVSLTGEIYKRYQNRCFQAGAMDFDELLVQTNILLRDHPDVLARYQEQFRYVLVDEYQDTNFAQHLIVTRLCEKHQHVFAVGDDAQSIYSFRGANIDNMLRFKDQYPTCRIFKLEQNYRSTQNIVGAANSLIAKNKEQIKKTIYSKKEKGSKLMIFSTYSDYEEGYLVSSRLMDMMRDNDYSYSDFAILYRTNAQSRVLEEAMRKRMIPYKVYGSQSFYQRKEIKDVIAYLRVIVNPKDEESLKRIINYPARGIGNTTLDKLQQAAVSVNDSLWNVIAAPLDYDVSINRGTAGKLQSFRALIEDFQENNKRMTAAEMAKDVVRKSGIAGLLFQDMSVEGISRQENVQELLNAINEFVSMQEEEGSANRSLTDFLVEVSLMTDQDNDKDEQADKVTLMTVHAAKGLEFKNVFIVGMENDLFPSQRAMDSSRSIEEERRLFYVAITRTKDNCIITHSKNRFRNGKSNTATPSFFLNDLDEQYIEYADDVALPMQKWTSFSSSSILSGASKDAGERRSDTLMWREQTGYGMNLAWDADMNSYGRSKAKTARNVDSGKTTARSNEARTLQTTPRYTCWEKTEKSDNAAPTGKMRSIGGLTAGGRVAHERFGEGTIIDIEGKGNDAKVTVEFVNAGTKTLLLKFAKLKVI
jgi:DNA helicase-2/ATP-dependent DNA helicase PcrA